jgi:hypothetical protein
MSGYNATVQLFSRLCLLQLKQPLSSLDAANIGFGAALVHSLVVANFQPAD